MTYEEARKEIIEDGIRLGGGDYVSVEALRVAAEALGPMAPTKRIKRKGARDFCIYLIDHAKKGKIRINDLPDFFRDWCDAL